MTICPNCQTPVDEGLEQCPYCEQSLEVEPPRKLPGERVAEVNLKKGNPDSQLALERLEYAIELHRGKGTAVLRLIHGYGSAGVGGTIRTEVRRRLEQIRSQGRIRRVVPGEDILRSRHRELPDWFEQDPSDVSNPGITVVVF